MQKPDMSRLHELLSEASRKAHTVGGEHLVSHAQSMPAIDLLELFARVRNIISERWYWEHSDADWALLSLGALTGSTPPRNVRFSELKRLFRQYANRVTAENDSDAELSHPYFHVAFSFDPWEEPDRAVWQFFPSTYLLIPRVTFIRDQDTHTLVVNALVTRGTKIDELHTSISNFFDVIGNANDSTAESHLSVDVQPHDVTNEKEIRTFINAVDRAEAAIRDGLVDVMTIARREKIVNRGLFRLRNTLQNLRGRYPHARLVATGRHGSNYVGLSSELMVCQMGSNISATCSVGSIRRGDTPQLDSALASQLAEHPDKLEHHKLSVAHIIEGLSTCCDGVEAPDEPSVETTTERHYLISHVLGTQSESSTIFDVLQAMHPLVESSGEPVEAAAERLREYERLDRGWFAAPYGWLDLSGNGEFVTSTQAMVVQAPVLDQQRAYLFAHVPVHSGADPDDLLEQTMQELEPLKTALSQ